MTSFAADWLALREPYDHAARSGTLADRFAAALGPAPRLLDLGCGAGANLRYLAPRLAQPQDWLCVDRDRDLLARAEARLDRWRGEVGWRGSMRFAALDLATGLDALALDGAAVAASALLDLTSAAWLDALAARCRRTPVLMALSFDGRLEWRPALAEDDLVRERFVAHQRRDKGFGPALGPDASAHLADRLAASHRVASARSDWRLGPADRALLAATLEGIVAAAAAIAADRRLEEWAEARRRQLAEDELRLTVGHLDLLALPEAA